MFGDDDIEDQQPDVVGVADGEADEEDQEITLSDSWVVINSYFDANNLVSQQLESFNHFCKIKLQVRRRLGCSQPRPTAGRPQALHSTGLLPWPDLSHRVTCASVVHLARCAK